MRAKIMRPWYELAFGEYYPLVYTHRSDQAAQQEAEFVIEHMQLSSAAPVLDLACGNGRHAQVLQQQGLAVCGLDLSWPLLKQSARREGLRLVRADMRSLPFAEGTFQAVASFFTSFGYFESEAEDLLCLQEIRRILRPGGWWFLDYLHVPSVESGLVPHSERTTPHARIIEDRRIHKGRVFKRVRIISTEDKPMLEYEESVRLYRPHEIEQSCLAQGLQPEAWFGDFQGGALDSGPRALLFVRKMP